MDVGEDTRAKKDHGRIMVIFGVSQIVVGVLCVVMGIVAVAFRCTFHNGGPPIWFGFLFLGTGVVGFLSSIKTTRCLTTSFMVMSIISAVSSALLLIIMLLALLREDRILTDNETCLYGLNDCEARVRRNRAVDGVIILLTILEGIIAILASIIGCRDACSCCQEQTPETNDSDERRQ